MINFDPFPSLETKNLVLRRMAYSDTKDLFEMRRDPRMHQHTDTKPDENTNETKAYIDKMNKGIDENKWIIWAIEHKHSKKVIGSISIWNINIEENSAELGYGIIPEFQGQGLMKEALLSVLEYGFHVMKLWYLDAYTEENNLNSINLLEKCHFHKINLIHEDGYVKNRTFSMVVYRSSSLFSN